ncbi:long-chain fatty acid-CoA ligase, partial [Dinochytrium kinnereticum]
MTKVRQSPSHLQTVFHLAYTLKSFLLNLNLPTTLLDHLIFNKIKLQTGGRLKFAVSGGAPIPRSTQAFLSVCVCPLVSGYGMTESVGVGTFQRIERWVGTGVVGAPVGACEVVMKGYYNQDQMTKEALTEDGWLMTGDIGEWLPDGSLAIIDRKKNLVKLQNGEYIALEKLESIYKTSPYVQNICIYGDSEQPFCVALVQPVEAELRRALKAGNVLGVDDMEVGVLAGLEESRRIVAGSLRSVAAAGGLKGAEVVGGVEVVGEEWSTLNGLL